MSEQKIITIHPIIQIKYCGTRSDTISFIQDANFKFSSWQYTIKSSGMLYPSYSALAILQLSLQVRWPNHDVKWNIKQFSRVTDSIESSQENEAFLRKVSFFIIHVRPLLQTERLYIGLLLDLNKDQSNIIYILRGCPTAYINLILYFIQVQ